MPVIFLPAAHFLIRIIRFISYPDSRNKVPLHFTHELLRELDIDDCDMVARQLELILEGVSDKLLISAAAVILILPPAGRGRADYGRCRKNGALQLIYSPLA
ncbi:hypothetical protein ACNKHW_27020 [Shigella flexneri]